MRVVQQQILGRADVIKVANEEFRFYADVAKAAPAVAAVPAAAPVVPVVPSVVSAPPPPVA